jgi:integrase
MPRKVTKVPTEEEYMFSTPAGRHYYGDGLCLVVHPDLFQRKWIFRYKSLITHRPTETTIGSVHLISYEEARDRIARMRRQLAGGEDPVDAHRQIRREVRARQTTFHQVATEWLALQDHWRSAEHREHVERMLFKHGAALCSLPVGSITPVMVQQVLKPLISAHPDTGRRTLRIWVQVFKLAKAHGRFDDDNPAQLHLDQLPNRNGSTEHHPAMPYAQIPTFITALRQQQSTSTAARALEFCILTATRTNETLGAQGEEFDLTGRVWTIPSERTKNGKPFRVPLSDRALELIGAPNAGYIFPGLNGPLCDKAMRWVMRALRPTGQSSPVGPYTVHGFRSTFAQWGQDETNFDPYVLDMCLAHALGNKVTRAYLRSDALEKRVEVMDAWATFCGSASLQGITS